MVPAATSPTRATSSVPEHAAAAWVGPSAPTRSAARASAASWRCEFDFVVSTNTAAVQLWKRLGLEVVGRIPDDLHHPVRGMVEAYVMHRFL